MINEQIELFKATIKGKKIAVLGLGISNLPAIKFLHKFGAVITARDRTPYDELDNDKLEVVKAYCMDFVLGDGYLDNLDGYDIIVKSPGIPPYAGQIESAVKNGAHLTSEMEIFMTLCPCKIVGVTGSDGKTTTTTVIYEMLKAEGKKVYVGGNIGSPLLDKVEQMNENDWVVLELSSFQLQTMKISPDIAVITNLSPNHLDYHKGGMAEYINAKTNIFNYQNENGKLVINADNDVTSSFEGKQKGNLMFFTRRDYNKDIACSQIKDGKIYCCGEYIMDVSDIRIKGMHNAENYLAAIAAVYGIVDPENMRNVARTFGGVRHRMQYVRTVDGIEFYNDSIGSSPSRTIAGLVAHGGKIVLIAGGYDKKIPFDTLGEAVNRYVSVIVLCGNTSDKIEKAVKDADKDKKDIPIIKTDDFESAVKTAFAAAKGIDVDGERVSVILSPACASFDMFKNFEQRGDKFIEIVNSL